MTTTSIRLGHMGSLTRLHGADLSEADMKRWVAAAVRAVRASLPGSAVWVPSTSEIIYDVGDPEVEEWAEDGRAIEALFDEVLALAWDDFCR
jgi:hypothetical protein